MHLHPLHPIVSTYNTSIGNYILNSVLTTVASIYMLALLLVPLHGIPVSTEEWDHLLIMMATVLYVLLSENITMCVDSNVTLGIAHMTTLV